MFNLFKKRTEEADEKPLVPSDVFTDPRKILKEINNNKKQSQIICKHGYGHCPQCHDHITIPQWNT